LCLFILGLELHQHALWKCKHDRVHHRGERHDQGFMEFFSQNYYIVQLECTHVASLDRTEDSTIVVSTLAALAQIKLLGYAEILNFHFEEQFFLWKKMKNLLKY
jgi:hypothetical protein